jgi:hypothetical protein
MGFEAKSRWGKHPGKWRPQKPASSTAASSQGGWIPDDHVESLATAEENLGKRATGK